MLHKIQRFFEPSMQIKGAFFRMILRSFLVGSFSFILIIFLKKIIEGVQINDIQYLQEILVWFIVVNIAYFILLFFMRNWGWSEFYIKHLAHIEVQSYQQFYQIDNLYTEKIGTGKIISILNDGNEKWTFFVLDFCENFVKLVFAFGMTLVFLFPLGWEFMGFFLVIFFLIQYIAYVINNKAIIYRNKCSVPRLEQARHTIRFIMSKFEILQNNKIGHEINILNDLMEMREIANKKLNNYVTGLMAIPDGTLFVLILGLVFVLFHYQGNIASLVSVFLVLTLFSRTLSISIEFFKDMTRDFYKVEQLWNFFDEAPKLDLQKEKPDFKYKTGDIEIQNVSFGYGEKNEVFSDLSLKLSGSKKIAFVGASGGGKTTLIKLISGFIKPQSGNIFIDGQKLSEVSLESYYKNIGYLTQEPSVFDGSIEENLLYGVPEKSVDFSEIQQAIKNAGCEFIYDLSNGLQTQIGEKGVRLSGGQKQRLAIAKLFLKDPNIIILDEPTSALDSFSEEKITQSLQKLFAGRTVLIIAHRLQTVKDADEIIVFEDGKVIEEGNHDELVAKKGQYAKMLDLQSGF